jgi:hypothetical protein
MAVSSGVINGNTIGLYVGTDLIALGRSSDFSIEMSSIDITTKDSAGATQIIPGLRSNSFNAEFLFDNDSTKGFEEMYDAWFDGTALTVVDMSGEIGDTSYTSTAYITSCTKSNPANDVVTVSVSFQASGDPAKAVIT